MDNMAYRSWLIPWMVICAGIGGLLYGYDIGVIAGALHYIRQIIPMSNSAAGFIVGAVLGGGFIACVIAGFFADRYGRRTTILAACVVFIVGLISIFFARTVVVLLIARLLLGLGVGSMSVAIPLYLSEVAPAHLRGMSITVFQLFLTFGIVFAYFVDLLFTSSGNWQGMFAVLFIPVLFLFVNMLLLPESPRWLLGHQKSDKAWKILCRTRPHHSVQEEFNMIKAGLKHSTVNWRSLFSKKLALPVFLSLFIAVCNQLTGINAVLQYAPTLFSRAGFHTQNHLMQATVLIGSINFLGTIVGMFLIDRMGRRFLLLLGTSVLCLSDVVLASLPHFMLSPDLLAQLNLIVLLCWVAGFAVGPGIVVWIIIAELVPTRVRGKNIAIALSVNALVGTLLASVFLPIINDIGMSNVFWLLGCFTLIYGVGCAWLLPETKGRTLEVIQEQW